MARDTAIRFNHPDLDAGRAGLRLTPAGGTLALVDGEAAVRQAILLLLSTRPGERVMRPDYGCDIHQLAFAENDETTAALAIHFVRQALLRWEPRVDIVNLDAEPQPVAGVLTIDLTYQVRLTRRQESLRFSLNLP
ncbi:MAG: GPW/gp25 family protein [Anaerolineales bacterium]|nr:GPW/gp25 family protein [Anaerolineales bacterium]